MGFHALSCLKKLFSEAHCGSGPVYLIPHCARGMFEIMMAQKINFGLPEFFDKVCVQVFFMLERLQ